MGAESGGCCEVGEDGVERLISGVLLRRCHLYGDSSHLASL